MRAPRSTRTRGISQLVVGVLAVIVIVIIVAGVYVATRQNVATTLTVTQGSTVTTTASGATVTTSHSTQSVAPVVGKYNGTIVPFTFMTYGGPNQVIFQAIAKNFTALTGIPVSITASVGSAAQELPRLLSGQDTPDIVDTSPPGAIALAAAGKGVPLNNVSAVNALPSVYKQAANGSIYLAAYWGPAEGILYNSQVLPNPPFSTWAGFVSFVESGKFNGTIGIQPVSRYEGGTLIQFSYLAGGDVNNTAGGWSTIEAMAPHIKYVSSGDSALTAGLEAGNVQLIGPAPIADGYSAYLAGAPIHVILPSDGPIISVPSGFFILNSRITAEADLFITYCLSVPEQDFIASLTGVLPTNPNATLPPLAMQWLNISSIAQITSRLVLPNQYVINQQNNNWITEWNNQVAPKLG
jgi:ABC-type Fe3+ transport system substrate-binding protein